MKKTIGKMTIEEIMADVSEQLEGNRPDPTWFSASQFAQFKGVTRSSAHDMLDKLVRAGKLKVHKCCAGKGPQQNFYEKC